MKLKSSSQYTLKSHSINIQHLLGDFFFKALSKVELVYLSSMIDDGITLQKHSHRSREIEKNAYSPLLFSDGVNQI